MALPSTCVRPKDPVVAKVELRNRAAKVIPRHRLLSGFTSEEERDPRRPKPAIGREGPPDLGIGAEVVLGRRAVRDNAIDGPTEGFTVIDNVLGLWFLAAHVWKKITGARPAQ